MDRWIGWLMGCLLLLVSALASASHAGAGGAAECVRPCPGRCGGDDGRWPARAESPVDYEAPRRDGSGCATDADDARPLRAPAPDPNRPSPCPPWRECALPVRPHGDAFQRFEDTARERLRPLPAPPIRG